ncbi:AAA family ATPase [Streptomyces misionensis]|uniref:AAA family ATPase n=1 Tax=Streptomyces misionensis TaxID=67331 RepID=UPI00115FE778
MQQAKNDTVRQAEEWIGYAVTGEDGEKVRIATGGLLGWSVEHLAARPVTPGEPGDPHLHVHVTIANMALCEDGEWRAIANSGQDFHRHAKALDAYFKARVRELTYATFGIRREYNPETRAWEIRHVPEELRDAFSRRHIALDERVGADASREDRQRIADETRRAKVDADASGMRSSWRTRAEAVVGDVDAMVAAAAPGPPDGGGAGIDGPGGGPQRPGPDDLARIVFDPETGLTASEKSFSRAQLLAAVATAMEFGIGAEPGLLDELADQVLAVEGYAVRLPHVGSTVMSSMDRYTTRDILDAEELVTSQALVRFDEGAVQLTTEQAAAAMSVFEVANGFALSGEQRAAIERTLTAGHGIDAHIGAAGTGKSTLMEACRIAWDATGHTYAGATVSAVAAKSLDDASGIPARSIASWLTQIRDGNGLTGIDVLVVDEATMSNDRQAAALMKEAQRTGTKLVAIGDPKQLQAIGPGGWFKEVHRLVGGLTLIENRRQRNDAERAALEVWRTGDHEQALRILADTGRVHATESAIEAHGQILTTWDEVRGRWTDPHDLIDSLTVLAAKNTDVDLLNLGAQQIRRQRGELGAEHRYALSGGADINFAVGDLVRVRQNDYRSRRGEGPDVLNGYRAVVTAIDEDHRVEITWRDKKTNDTVSAWFDPQAISSGALSLGYAMTVAASQGLTSEVSLLYGHGANAFAVYPASPAAAPRTTCGCPCRSSRTTRRRPASARPAPRPSGCSAPSPRSHASWDRTEATPWSRTCCANRRPRPYACRSRRACASTSGPAGRVRPPYDGPMRRQPSPPVAHARHRRRHSGSPPRPRRTPRPPTTSPCRYSPPPRTTPGSGPPTRSVWRRSSGGGRWRPCSPGRPGRTASGRMPNWPGLSSWPTSGPGSPSAVPRRRRRRRASSRNALPRRGRPGRPAGRRSSLRRRPCWTRRRRRPRRQPSNSPGRPTRARKRRNGTGTCATTWSRRRIWGPWSGCGPVSPRSRSQRTLPMSPPSGRPGTRRRARRAARPTRPGWRRGR